MELSVIQERDDEQSMNQSAAPTDVPRSVSFAEEKDKFVEENMENFNENRKVSLKLLKLFATFQTFNPPAFPLLKYGD